MSAVEIDLGTTNVVLAARQRGSVRTIPIEGASTMPSAVYYGSDASPEVGKNARARRLIEPEQTVRSSKRFMGDKEKQWSVQGRMVTPVDVAAAILGKAKKAAGRDAGEAKQAVVTVPAYFNGFQKQRTKQAAEQAGLDVLELLKEPTAAAIAYSIDRGRDQTILVYDMGGGTFDISVLEIQNNTFLERAIDGDTYLGGDDFDAAIKRYIVKQFEEAHKAFTPSPADKKKIGEVAEEMKQQLSAARRSKEQVVLSEGRAMDVELTRSAYEGLIEDKVEETIRIMRRALKKAGLGPDEVGRVVLVGGSTKTPLISERLTEEIRQPYQADNVDEVVAHGAATRAHELSAGRPVERSTGDSRPVELKKITPYNLGLRATDGRGIEKFSVIIPDQHAIPCEVQKTYTTERDGQTSVPVGVFQGFEERCDDAGVSFIGGFVLNGIPEAPSGEPDVEVTFRMTSNDLLEVEATCSGVQAHPITLNVNETHDPSEVFRNSEEAAVALCIDVSYSMEGKPLREAKKAASAYLSQKKAGRDRIGCVAFGTSATTAADVQSSFGPVQSGIEELSPTGSTDMAGGLSRSLQLLQDASGGLRRQIVLLSDGRPDSAHDVQEQIGSLNDANTTVHRVGAGGGYDRELLEEVASKTGGTFTAADDIDDLVETFVRLAEK